MGVVKSFGKLFNTFLISINRIFIVLQFGIGIAQTAVFGRTYKNVVWY